MTGRALFVLVLALLPLGGLAAAPEPPDGFDEAVRTLRQKDFAEAETAFQRILEEQPAYWPARDGVAQALLGQERAPDAVKVWRQAALDADRAGVDPDLRFPYKKMREALTKHDKPSGELDRLLQAAAKDLTKFATSSKVRKVPALSETTLRSALRLDPMYAKAETALKKMKALPSGQWVRQFHGNMKAWGDLNAAEWKPKNETTLEVDGLTVGYQAWTDRVFHGDFDFRVEVKLIERGAKNWSLTMNAGMSRDDMISWGIGQDQALLIPYRLESDGRTSLFNDALDNLKPPVDPTKFNRFELRFRGDQVEARINGHLIKTTRRVFTMHRARLGVGFGKAKGQFRNMEVRQR